MGGVHCTLFFLEAGSGPELTIMLVFVSSGKSDIKIPVESAQGHRTQIVCMLWCVLGKSIAGSKPHVYQKCN